MNIPKELQYRFEYNQRLYNDEDFFIQEIKKSYQLWHYDTNTPYTEDEIRKIYNDTIIPYKNYNLEIVQNNYDYFLNNHFTHLHKTSLDKPDCAANNIVINHPIEYNIANFLIPYMSNFCKQLPKYVLYNYDDNFTLKFLSEKEKDKTCLPDIYYKDFIGIEIKYRNLNNFTGSAIGFHQNKFKYFEKTPGYILIVNSHPTSDKNNYKMIILDIAELSKSPLYYSNNDFCISMAQIYAIVTNSGLKHNWYTQEEFIDIIKRNDSGSVYNKLYNELRWRDMDKEEYHGDKYAMVCNINPFKYNLTKVYLNNKQYLCSSKILYNKLIQYQSLTSGSDLGITLWSEFKAEWDDMIKNGEAIKL